MMAMHKIQPSLHIKNPQKQQLTSSKTFETTICKGVDGLRKFIMKSMKNPEKRFRGKKRGLRYMMCQKSYLKTNGDRRVAKTESQQTGELQIRTLQSATPSSSSVSTSQEELRNANYLFRLKQKQRKFESGRYNSYSRRRQMKDTKNLLKKRDNRKYITERRSGISQHIHNAH